MPGVRIDNWKGLATAISPYVLPPGATVRHNNLQITRPGELRQRPGMEAIFTSNDYSGIIGVYRVSNSVNSGDDLIVCSRTSATQTTIRYQSPTETDNEIAWAFSPGYVVTTDSLVSPSFAEDRHGRIYIFHGNGVDPLAMPRTTQQAIVMGLQAPTIAPSVTPSGNGYFIERVDVLDGGGSYWAAPPIVITGGGARVRDARLKAIVQGGSVTAVDVIDGGSGYQTAPTLTVDESSVKGVGFRAYGIIGIDPGLQGLEPVFTTTGTTSLNGSNITAVGNINKVRVGARVSGTGIPLNATVWSVTTSTNSFSISPAVANANGTVTLTFNEPVRTGSTNASFSHAYVVDPGSTTIAYTFTATGTTNTSTALTAVSNASRILVGARVTGTGIQANTTVSSVDPTTGTVTISPAATASATVTLTFTQGATATFDSTTSTYSALIPLTPGASSVGSGASALVSFSMQTGSLSNSVTTATTQDPTWPVRPTDAFFGTAVSTLATGTSFDYFINTDDCSQRPNDLVNGTWYYADYQWWNNNYDFFAAFAPNFQVNFHSRAKINRGSYGATNNVPWPVYDRYADLYTWDYSKISLRYYTGSRAELETATDTEDKWVWVTVPVQTSGGAPYVEVTLTPAKKTATTNYATYPGYRPPTVRIWLLYCPDSWLSGIADNQLNVGWRRTVGATRPGETNPAANAATTNTAKGWWTAGAAETGAAKRPIVNFRTAPGTASPGITKDTVAVIDPGSGMEQQTFFALQFDQINAASSFWATGYSLNTTDASMHADGSILRPASGNPVSGAVAWANIDKNPAAPTYTAEYQQTFNPARFTKTFSQYRQRLYFWANTIVDGQQGPPGAVLGTPTVSIPGSNFLTGDTAAFTLRQRSENTSPPSSATFTDGYTYTFTARQITQPATTTSITSVQISSAGTNYYGTPQLKYSGNGYGLTLDPVVSNGTISAINITNGGSGFTQSPLITADSQTAKLIPVMRPAMRGTYRCAYRFADWSMTELSRPNITTTSGSTTATVSNTVGLAPGIVIESDNVPFMAKIVSISGSTITLSAAATVTGTAPAIVRDMTKPIFYSNFSPITDVDTTQFAAVPRPTQMVWNLSGVQPPSRATVVEFFRTSGDESLVFYRLEQYGKVAGNSVNIVGSDTMTDEDLFNPNRPFYAAMPVVLPNGGLNAYRFGVPRNDMSVCAAYGDRLWYAVSTSGENANSVFFSEFDEFESCPAENEIAIQNNQKTTDSLVGLIPYATYLLCMQNSHCYGLSYNTDPTVDASIQLLANRGMLSQGCYDMFDDRVYAMDERGIYVMERSGNVESLSDPIRNYFDLGLLDLNYRKKFFVKVDQRNSILRAFVVTKGSNATSPNMAFCYHIDLKTWWTESWPNGLTCAINYRRSFTEQDRVVYGAVDGDLYREGGLRDYTYRSLKSVTVTNGGSGYKAAPEVRVASGQNGCGASFTAVVVNGAVSEILIDEPGFGYGVVTAGVLNPAVTLTIAPPPSGTTATASAVCHDLYQASGDFTQVSVPYAVRTGAMELVNDGNANTKDAMQDRSVSVIYRPTETNSDLHLREFFNNSPQPRINVMARDRGTGFVHDTTGAKTRLNMSSTRSSLGLSTGVAKAQFAGRNYSDMGGADRHVAVELSGPSVLAGTADPAPSEVLLYGLEVNGVLDNGG